MNLAHLLDLEKYPAALRYTEEEYDLGRFAAWLRALGSPQDGQTFLHVAGTKGKGSTAAILEGIFRGLGFHTALFTSPHLEHYGERFRFDGVPWTRQEFDARLARFSDSLGPDQRAGLDGPVPFRTVFEILTALALVEFKARPLPPGGKQIVIWETGLGGRLDCTNIVTPAVSVITTMGLDHQRILGDTIEKITAEKAGIIKPGRPVVLSRQDQQFAAAVRGVVATRAAETGSRLIYADELIDLPPGCPASGGQRFTWNGRDFHLPLHGLFQRSNIEAALAAMLVLEPHPDWDAVARGIELVNWPGRMEEIRMAERLWILDGAHCPLSARALGESLLAEGHVPFTLLFSMQKDKDAAAFLSALHNRIGAAGIREVCCYSIGGPRGADAEELAAVARGHGLRARAFQSLEHAVEAAAAGSSVVVAAGTLYTPARIRKLIGAADA